MSVEFETQDVLERISCVSCGVLFAVPKEFLNTRRQDPNKSFHCPNGHTMVYPKAKTHEILTKEVETLTAKNKELQQNNVNLRAQLDQLEARLEIAGLKSTAPEKLND